MWKRDEEQVTRVTQVTGGAVESARTPSARTNHATIGPSIVIKGEVSGKEDLVIQGRVDGTVSLETHTVTVGGGGRVKANISGRVITIEGDVEGDLSAQEQIVLRGSAKVQGDLKAPRVVLEDGARFKGLVDMGPAAEGVKKAEMHRPGAPEPIVAAAAATGKPGKEPSERRAGS